MKHEHQEPENYKLGFAGTLGKMFAQSKLTPVITIASLLLGLFAVILTPKEEEPQISVPMIDIQIAAPGYSPQEVERKITEPVERAVWGLDGVDYIYSASQKHGTLITVRFKVGEPIEPSLVKIHHKLMTLQSELPKNTQAPKVRSFSIDDVPFLTLTFSSDELSPYELRQEIAPLARELSSTPDLSRVELLGGLKRAIRVVADPEKMQNRGVTLTQIANALQTNDLLLPAGKNWGTEKVFDVDVGGRLSNVSEIGAIAIGQRAGSVVRINDVAQITDGPEEVTRESILFDKNHNGTRQNAVSIVFAKRKGTNVVVLSKKLIQRAEAFKKQINSKIKMSEVRNYGSTAEDKSNELIEHLLLATLSVSALIALFVGLRASIVVVIAIPVTLALTLAIYYFLGYTLNRVTLFALIFSIGILVDDAIVVVENIERHLKINKGRKSFLQTTLDAVAEVGNPTILATFTVIASILPMAFVSGLMGPYMKPIPVGASLAMILSLFVAFMVTPWAALKLLKPDAHSHDEKTSKLDEIYKNTMNWLLSSKKAALQFGALTVALLMISASLVYFKVVKVKMLPFDNKNEFQIIVDYPPTTTLKQNLKLSEELSNELIQNSNIEKIQIYAGEPAPYSFSGMVKHTFLRGNDYQSDLQIVLVDKSKRKESSHQIIEKIRPLVRDFGLRNNAVTKVLEIPPGPPVMATLMTEIYGPTDESRLKTAKEIETLFRAQNNLADIDTTYREGRPRQIYQFNSYKGGLLGANASALAYLGQATFSENSLVSLNDQSSPEEVKVDLSFASANRSGPAPFHKQRILSFESGVVDAENILNPVKTETSRTLYRKNLKPVEYVMSEPFGAEEAPVYSILKLEPQIKYPVQTTEVPWDTQSPVVKWDGEMFITYEVFRDLGSAFGVVMILIYVLVLGWFRSFTIPLIIMAPIPISLIGILPGHGLSGIYFTAPSMIGFIAGAGIIVRNSIILVDFIQHQLTRGMEVKEAVISAGVLRFRPMLLTAAAVVVGSSVMLFDPIFQGLAISLMFGEIAATILSRFAVPTLYYWFIGGKKV